MFMQRVSVLVQRYISLSCYMIPCQPVTARTDDLYPMLYYAYLNFSTPSKTYLPTVNNNNNNIIIIIIIIIMCRSAETRANSYRTHITV